MRFEKLGKIFDPTNHALPNGCREFAQSPQALVLPNRVRIYFSTRERDAMGKYLSHVAYAEFSKDLREVLSVAAVAALPLGALGCYDEHGIFPLNPLRVGERVYGYIGGWNRRVSVSVDGSIGVAVSDDGGRCFERIGDGPVVTTSLNEPFLVGDPFVQRYDGVFHMWYIFGTVWQRFSPAAAPDRTYKIGHAVSHDGVSWEKPTEGHAIVADVLGPDESQALPTVLRVGSRYHMLFCYRQSFDFRRTVGRGYRLGHAYSEDLRTWTRDDASVGIDVTSGSWDSEMMCYPHLFEMDGIVYLLYNGNEFGRAGFGAARLVG